MKLKKVKEHFATKDRGKTWYPKRVFTSDQEALDLGFHKGRWVTYICGFCDKIHVAEIKERKYR